MISRILPRGLILLSLLSFLIWPVPGTLAQPEPALRVKAGGPPPPGSGPQRAAQFVRVLDGQSFETLINGQRAIVGILGISAPPGNTDCGRQAAGMLWPLANAGLRLAEDLSFPFDAQYRRMYDVYTSSGRSLALTLVEAGLARADGHGPRRDQLAAAEAQARARQVGCVWRPTVQPGGALPVVFGPSARQAQLARQARAAWQAQARAANVSAAVSTTFPSFFSQQSVAREIDAPTAFAFLPDGRILIAEKFGLIRVWNPDPNIGLLDAPLMNIHTKVNDYSDHGLIGLTVDPNFAANGYIYLAYTYENNPANYTAAKTARVARYTVSPPTANTANPATELVLVGSQVGTPAQPSCDNFPLGADCIPSDAESHSVGNLRFAPDGTLYVTMGDAASFNTPDDRALRAQNLDSLAGKMLRINPANGRGVPGNPFFNAAQPDANRSKVWAYGLRNPFRYSFRPGSNLPYVGDVGWDSWEEVNVVPAGANLGWPCFEGVYRQGGYEPKPPCQALYAAGPNAVKPPVLAWPHQDEFGYVLGSASVGGIFYTESKFPAQYQGAYFYGDYAQGLIRTLQVDASNTLVPNSALTFATYADGPVAFEQGADGDLYYLAINVGELRKVTYTPGNTPPIAVAGTTSPAGILAPGSISFSSAGSVDPDGDPLTFAWDFADGSPLSNEPNPTHAYAANFPAPHGATAVLTVRDNRGGSSQAFVTIAVGNRAPAPTISAPNPATYRWKVADTVNFAGGATDPDGDTVILEWKVNLRHCPGGTCHTHFSVAGEAGPMGNFLIDDHGDEVEFEIILTAFDSKGLAASTKVVILPQTVAVTLKSNPPGLTVIYDGRKYVTDPGTGAVVRHSVSGSKHTLVAPDLGAAKFTSWSDAGARQHQINVANAPLSFTANYTVNYPAPTLAGLSPDGAAAGSQALQVTVKGSGFVSPNGVLPGTIMRWNGKDRPTMFVNPETLLVTLPASDLIAQGTFPCTVFNPTPGGGLSGPQPFTVSAAHSQLPVVTR